MKKYKAMKKYLILLGIITSILFSQCKTEELPDNNLLSFDCENTDGCALVEANNQFGFNLFKALHDEKPEENIFISPLSISTALSMVLNGADGETKSQMQEVLNTANLDLESVNQAYKYLLGILPDLDPLVQMDIANSIWYDEGYPVHDDFLNTNTTYFDSEVLPSDFKDPATVGLINSWVDDKTQGKITSVLDNIPPDVIMYLINAIYFKGDWLYTFDEEQTIEMNFNLPNGQQSPVDMMGFDGSTNTAYFENDLFQAVDLPYGDSIYSMTLLLPKETVGMNTLVDNLSIENWVDWMASFENNEVYLKVPKFKLEYKKELKGILSDLGMEDAFTQKADLSKIGPGALIISKVLHKSFLEVNEQGTEAAAVTVIGIENTSTNPDQPPVVFFNKPFLLVIRENVSNSVLFMGQIENPTE